MQRPRARTLRIWNIIACSLVLTLLPLATSPGAARAAELNGVTLPEVINIENHTLRLNGIGLRTWSIFNIPIYVAGLYLEQPSRDPTAILNSHAIKAIKIRFVHDVDAEHVRKAWREGFELDCLAPCHLEPEHVRRFMAAVPDLRNGDESLLIYAPDWVSISVNGREMGRIQDADMMRVLLATFIGPHPPTERLKRELLAGRQ